MLCEWQPAETGCGLWQQLCGAECDAQAHSICGQDRQFPNNRAATMRTTVNELNIARTKLYSMSEMEFLQQSCG